LGNTRFVQRWIVNPYFSISENSWTLTNIQFRFQPKDFFNDGDVAPREVRDALNYMIGPTHFFLFSGGRHYIKLGYQYDSADAKGANWSYWGNRLLVGLQYILPWWDIRFRFDLDFHWRNYKNKNSLLPADARFTNRRCDAEGVYFTSLSKDFAIKSQNFTVSIDYLFDDNSSNLAAFDCVRNVATTSITWKF